MSLKKASKSFVLSDSSVNELGFRLLTSGYQMPEFLKNPIGYYMHKRDEGVALKWDDLHVEGDNIVGTPVINLAHSRGQQMIDEVENGFLNAASMGHFVFLEWSTEPSLMLEGQTGPTITKWYNKESSLVDIPGNANATVQLFDISGNEIKLADLSTGIKFKNNIMEIKLSPEAAAELKLAASSDSAAINAAIIQLGARANKAETDLANLQKESKANEVKALLDAGLEAKKITVALSTQLGKDYAENPTGLKTILDGMGTYTSVTSQIDEAAKKLALKYEGKDWDQLKDSNLMADFKKECPDQYRELYKKTFKKDCPDPIA